MEMVDREAEGSDSLEASRGGDADYYLLITAHNAGLHVDALNSWWNWLGFRLIHARTTE